MTRPNKNPVYVTEEFKRASINMIKQVLRSNRVMYHNNYETDKSIAFSVPTADISIDFYDYYNGKVKYCDLYIGSDAIRYTGEQAQALCDAFHARWSEQSKDNTAAKEAELAAKLQQYIGNTK